MFSVSYVVGRRWFWNRLSLWYPGGSGIVVWTVRGAQLVTKKKKVLPGLIPRLKLRGAFPPFPLHKRWACCQERVHKFPLPAHPLQRKLASLHSSIRWNYVGLLTELDDSSFCPSVRVIFMEFTVYRYSNLVSGVERASCVRSFVRSFVRSLLCLLFLSSRLRTVSVIILFGVFGRYSDWPTGWTVWGSTAGRGEASLISCPDRPWEGGGGSSQPHVQ